LEETPETGLFKRLGRAANQAAELAWAASYPLLFFPHLFDEMLKQFEISFNTSKLAMPSRRLSLGC